MSTKTTEQQKRFLSTHPHYNAYQCWKRRLKINQKKGKRTEEEILDYEEYLEKEYGITPEQLPFYLEQIKKEKSNERASQSSQTL